MTASYRLVQFSPDPFTGARAPIGAVVVDRAGAVRVARAARPGVGLSPDPGVQRVVQRLHARLDAITSPDALPPAFGPYVTLDAPVTVPEAVLDPVAWVHSLLNPKPALGGRQGHARGPSRATVGYRYLESLGVAKHVRKNFQPETDLDGWLSPFAGGLTPITHWVAGEREVLLMEPLVPGRRSEEVREIAQRVGAYRWALEQARSQVRGRLVVYVAEALGLNEPDASAFRVFAHDVVSGPEGLDSLRTMIRDA